MSTEESTYRIIQLPIRTFFCIYKFCGLTHSEVPIDTAAWGGISTLTPVNTPLNLYTFFVALGSSSGSTNNL